MGSCCTNLTADERIALEAERIRSNRIEQNQRASVLKTQEYIKLLLLGAGESGKSTLFKQMIALYGKGYTDDERKKFTSIISQNIISAMHNLVKRTRYGNMEDNFDGLETFGQLEEHNWEAANHIMDMTQDDVIGELEATYIADI